MSLRKLLIVLVALGIQAPACIGISYAANLVEGTETAIIQNGDAMSPANQSIYTCDNGPEVQENTDASRSNSGCQDTSSCISSASSTIRESIVATMESKALSLLDFSDVLVFASNESEFSQFVYDQLPPPDNHARYYAHILVKRE